MTIQHVYNLFDSTIETYVAQFMSTHDKLMKRECENLFKQSQLAHQNNPVSAQGALYRYSDSFYMIHTADFDDQTGIYTQLEVPVTICNFAIFNDNTNSNSSLSSTQNTDEKVYASMISNS